jgi:hypothetical protein
VISRLYGNYSGIGSSDEITPRRAASARPSRSRPTPSPRGPAATPNRDWDIDEQLWDSHGGLDHAAGWRPIGRTS